MQPRLLVTDILKELLYTFVQSELEVEQEIKYSVGAYNEEA